jgi:hypothetical protein
MLIIIKVIIITMPKIRNSWHMFNCKNLFKLQIRPPNLILLITTSQPKPRGEKFDDDDDDDNGNNNNNNNNNRK